MPRISVLIPTYNRDRYLIEAIRSVEAQTSRDWEMVVADDGSTDDTRRVVEAFGGAVRYLYQQNQGVSAARNLAFRESSGEYVVFLDSDDYLLPNALADLSAALDSDRNCDVVYSDGFVVDDGGARLAAISDYSPRPFDDTIGSFIVGNPLGLHGTMFRRSALMRVDGPFDEQMLGYEDWDMLMRLKASDGIFCFLPVRTACYRFHGGNKSAPKSSLAEKRRLSLIRSRQNAMDAPWFAGLPLATKQTFFAELLTRTLNGDRPRQRAVASLHAFRSLPDKVRSGLLYRLAVSNILATGAQREDRKAVVTTIRLDPLNLKAYPLLALLLIGNGLPEKALSRWRKAHSAADPTDPVTQILRSKNVA